MWPKGIAHKGNARDWIWKLPWVDIKLERLLLLLVLVASSYIWTTFENCVTGFSTTGTGYKIWTRHPVLGFVGTQRVPLVLEYRSEFVLANLTSLARFLCVSPRLGKTLSRHADKSFGYSSSLFSLQLISSWLFWYLQDFFLTRHIFNIWQIVSFA